MHSPNCSILSSSSTFSPSLPPPPSIPFSSSSGSGSSSSSSDSIKVCVRVRPLNEKERSLRNSQSVWRTTNHSTIYSVSSQVLLNNSTATNSNSSSGNSNSIMMTPMVPSSSDVSYTFDQVYDQNSTTECVYSDMCKHIVTSSVRGYNGTIFAYGQTSSGKTFTMKGTKEIPGIIQLSIRDVFTTISQTQNRNFQIRVSYLEIYNEVIKDLLDPENQNLKIREDYINGKGVYVSGAREEEVASMEEMIKLMEKGEHFRHFGCTAMNDQSSRSHTIFRIMIESIEATVAQRVLEEEDFDIYASGSETSVLFSTLNLVDLAGSERVLYTQAQGDRLREGGHINKSLLTLGNVIAKLSEGTSSHIPYRDSKLTRILSNSLGGNSKTAIICTITPASQHFEETHSTLKFANRAKSIHNQVTINQIINEKALLKKLKQENEDWKTKFQERVNNIEDELHRSEREREEMIKSYEEKITLLQNQLEEKSLLDGTISSLRKTLQDKEKDVEWIETVARNDKQRLEQEKNSLQLEMTKLVEEHSNTLFKVKEDHEREIETLTLQHKTSMQELVYQHELEIQEHNQMISQLEVEYKDKLDRIVEDLKSKHSEELQSLISSHKTALQELHSSISENEALEFQTTIHSLQNTINELIPSKEELEIELELTRKEYSLIHKECENLSQIALLVGSLKDQVEQKDSLISSQQEQIDEYKHTLERVDEELTLLKEQQVDQLEIDHLKETVNSLAQSLEEKEKDVEKLQFDCEMYKSAAATNQATANLEELLHEKDAYISKLEQEVDIKERTFKQEMDEAIERIRELEQEKNTIIVGTTSQLEQINKVTSENERLVKEIKELRSKIEYGKAKSQQLIEERKRKENPNLADHHYYPKTPNSDFKKFKLDDDKENKLNI